MAALRDAVLARDLDRIKDLVYAGADPHQPWPGGGDGFSWAADRGDLEVLDGLLTYTREHGRPSKLAALNVARAWIATGVEDELRRRLDVPGGIVTRARVPHGIESLHTTLVRVTAPDGRTAEVLDTHRAVATVLEHSLAIATGRDELLARALYSGDPDSCDWNESLFEMTNHRIAGETYRWAIARIDDPQPVVRRFAADVLLGLSFEFTTDAIGEIRDRLECEQDAGVLATLLYAYAEYRGRGPVPELAPYLRHPHPRVREMAARLLDFRVAKATGRPIAGGCAGH